MTRRIHKKIFIIIGIITIIIAIIFMFIYIFIYLPMTVPGPALVRTQPFSDYLESQGAEKICDADFNGTGILAIDSHTPTNTTYLYMKDSESMDRIIEEASQKAGFSVSKSSGFLKNDIGVIVGKTDRFSNLTIAQLNLASDAPINTDSFTVEVIRNNTTTTEDYYYGCNGSKITATKDKVIVEAHTVIHQD